MNPLRHLPTDDALLVSQVQAFKAKVEREMDAYQKLLLLNMEMIAVLAPHKRHHHLVKEWAQLAGQLIAYD